MALAHSTLSHTFAPSLSSRIFLSAQKENLDEFHKEGRSPTPTVMSQAFFFSRERKLTTIQKCVNLQMLLILHATWSNGQAPVDFEARPATHSHMMCH